MPSNLITTYSEQGYRHAMSGGHFMENPYDGDSDERDIGEGYRHDEWARGFDEYEEAVERDAAVHGPWGAPYPPVPS